MIQTCCFIKCHSIMETKTESSKSNEQLIAMPSDAGRGRVEYFPIDINMRSVVLCVWFGDMSQQD